MVELPDECDFCNRVLDEDEELTPIWIGDSTEPQREVVRKTAGKVAQKVGAQARNGSRVVLNRDIGQVKALLDAVQSADMLTVSYKQSVMEEVRGVGSEDPQALVDGGSLTDDPPTYDEVFNENYDKVGVELSIESEPQEKDPDLEVCEHCEDSLSSM
jgi:hypothetical protein